MERNPSRKRSPAFAHQRCRQRWQHRTEDDPKQYFHNRQKERRRPRYAVPVSETNEQHLGVIRAKTTARQSRGDSQFEVPNGRGRLLYIPGVRSYYQVVISQCLYVYVGLKYSYLSKTCGNSIYDVWMYIKTLAFVVLEYYVIIIIIVLKIKLLKE